MGVHIYRNGFYTLPQVARFTGLTLSELDGVNLNPVYMHPDGRYMIIDTTPGCPDNEKYFLVIDRIIRREYFAQLNTPNQ